MSGCTVPVPTSPRSLWIVRTIAIACFQVWVAAAAQADVIYEYTGNPFTFVAPTLPQGGGPIEANPITTDDFVFGSITFTSPLSPDLPLQAVDPVAIIFNAGPITFLPGGAAAPSVSVATDSQGDIAQWQILLGTGDLSLQTVSCDFPSNSACEFSPADSVSPGDSTALIADVSDNPGRWATVPEPSTALLLTVGLVGLATVASLRQRVQTERGARGTP